MKKLLIILAILFQFTLCPYKATIAQAQRTPEYACILKSDVYFYKTESTSDGLFTLPKSYYVKVLSIGETFTKVSYLTETEYTQPIIGYCQTKDLTFVEYTPFNPYLYATFEVTYTAENADTSDDFLGKLQFTCAYYGDYYIGSKRYAYVLRNGEFAYVPKPLNFRYAESSEHAEWLSQQSPSTSDGSSTPMQVGVLVVLCLLVPILSALIIKSSRTPTYDLDE